MVEVPEDAGTTKIKEHCFNKQMTFHPHLLPSNILSAYDILLKGGNSAEFIPGTTNPFILKEYKDKVGIPYSSIVFLLDFVNGELQVLC